MSLPDKAGVHLEGGRPVGGAIRLGGPNNRHLVDVFAQVGKELGNLDPGLPAGLELEGRALELALSLLAYPLGGLEIILFAMPFAEGRLGVEGVHVARPSHHEKEDAVLGPGRKVGGGRRPPGPHPVPGQHPGHRRPEEAVAGLPQELPAGPAAGKVEGAGGVTHRS